MIQINTMVQGNIEKLNMMVYVINFIMLYYTVSLFCFKIIVFCDDACYQRSHELFMWWWNIIIPIYFDDRIFVCIDMDHGCHFCAEFRHMRNVQVSGGMLT